MIEFQFPSIVILSGAGISAESGLRTFRDPGGLWENHRPEEVASLEAFRQNPWMVQRFYNFRRAQLLSIQPNPAHIALAKLEQAWRGKFLIVTQNVDDLHERSGSQKLIHMHGELLKVRCLESDQIFPWKDPITPDSVCPCCNEVEKLRPHIVWFGETPLDMDRITKAVKECDFFISIGTSGQVYPAASFVNQIKDDAHSIEINLEKSSIAKRFKELRNGPAAKCVPALVDEFFQEWSLSIIDSKIST